MGRKINSYTEEYKNTIVKLFNNEKIYSELNKQIWSINNKPIAINERKNSGI
ncbi:hypothetical protein [Clostridium autoethanogenum]|uniref:hypothetical protein n=1 Tax=Clostridium autoethanogenum TaxID=84023 RepID=UPI001604C8DA|nr:hypothetical protein [Clostridium autoethanogenum]